MCTRALCKLSNAVHGTLGQNPSPSQREINGWAPRRKPRRDAGDVVSLESPVLRFGISGMSFDSL